MERNLTEAIQTEIRRCADSLSELWGPYAMFPLDHRMVCVLNLPEPVSTETAPWKICVHLRYIIGKRPAVRAAVGIPMEGPPNIQQLFRTACVAWDHGADDPRSALAWQELPWAEKLQQALDKSGGMTTADFERRFINFVNNGQLREAESTLAQIMEVHIWQSKAPLRHIASSCFFRLETVLELSGIDIEPGGTGQEMYEILEKMMLSASFSKLRGYVHDVFTLLTDMLGEKDARQKKTIRVQAFIRANYADANLDTSMICGHFHLSEDYLSRVFREEANMSILDCIHSIRIEKANQLLAETNKTIDEISMASGFTTTRTMNRLFNKLEGMPPRAWREMVRAKGTA